jgi:hypothetical protein
MIKHVKHVILDQTLNYELPLLESLEVHQLEDLYNMVPNFQSKQIIINCRNTLRTLSTFPFMCDNVTIESNIVVENLPKNICELTLIYPFRFENMIPNLDEFDYLTSLYIDSVGTYKKHFPIHLETLFINNCFMELNPGIFPNTLTKLTIALFVRYQDLQLGLFPQNLVYLKLGTFKRALRVGVIPQSVRVLKLPCYKKRIEKDVLPKKLEKLTIYKCYNENVLPSSLKKLTADCFHDIIPIYPLSLTSLHIFEFPTILPTFLIKLQIGKSCTMDKIETELGKFPTTLRELTIYTNENPSVNWDLGHWNKRSTKCWTLYLNGHAID